MVDNKKNEKETVVGGTFDILHDGHKKLLREAYGIGGRVMIGLTSDEMALQTRNREIAGFEDRKKELELFISGELKSKPDVVEIKDKFGSTLERDFDYIVVSPETFPTAIAINEERKKINKKSIEIIKIDFVLAEDGKPISSERISKGEIDKHGKLLS
ncbi:MAG: phosphopantetheine adenylyltransferase [Candidatus Nealsonbacteria bacterium CG_4_8_14_3_um_filter_39_7]|nr:MAG: phosphopantetheine adenylyltransferase [Candidatus Nealsonbacteria bacterium CG07_land_8_20_14_0_80_39_13]PIW91322.1 MAG: phosphopantetheine adenylyltransferase [Candidatus Nealsonbacteria bacterium CG_4_8_14_3_um_filter_39_7]